VVQSRAFNVINWKFIKKIKSPEPLQSLEFMTFFIGADEGNYTAALPVVGAAVVLAQAQGFGPSSLKTITDCFLNARCPFGFDSLLNLFHKKNRSNLMFDRFFLWSG